MPPEAIRSSISKMPLSRMPRVRRMVEALAEYMSDIPHLSLDAAGSARRRGVETDHHHRDVVGRAAIERQADQRLAGALRRKAGGQRQNFAVGDMGRQPVAADQEGIPRLHDAVGHFELRIVIGPDRPRDHVASRPRAGLLGGEPAVGDEFLHLGVIDRKLLDRKVTDAIYSAVTRPYAGEESFV